MEIRTYLNIILRYWWVVLLALVAGGVIAAGTDRIKKPTYNASARIAVRPSPDLSDTRSIIDLVGQLGAKYIAGTFAQTFTSADVKAASQKAVGLSAGDAINYPLDAVVLPDTAVIQVSGSGPDPVLLVNYINASLEAAIGSTRDLFRVIDMVTLEPARVPTAPVAPQPSRDIPFGAGIGLALGILLALILDFVRGLRNVRAATAPAPARPELATPPPVTTRR